MYSLSQDVRYAVRQLLRFLAVAKAARIYDDGGSDASPGQDAVVRRRG
jgi:hypothetical protein